MNNVIVWKDILMLQWDGQGIPGLKSVEDAPKYWEHLKGFANYSKRSGKYILSFSKQNIHRLAKQFPDNIRFTGDSRQQAELLFSFATGSKELVDKASRIITAPIETLPKYEYKVPPLGDYQHRGVVLLSEVKKVPLFADCGCGKTWMVLNSIQNHISQGIVPRGKTLICVKLATLESGWLEDAEKFTDLKLVPLWIPGSYKRKEKILELLNTPADAYVINHDGVRVYEDDLVKKQFQKVVVDESTILKSFHGTYEKIKGGQFGRSLLNVSHHAEWRVIMSGTPAPNGPEDLWGQFHFLDPHGFLLEKTYNDFLNEYMSQIVIRNNAMFERYGKDPSKWVPRSDTLDRVSAVINPMSFRVRIRDHLADLPEVTTIKRMVSLSKEQEKAYKELEHFLCTVIDDERVLVPAKIAELMKLRQITGGFLIDNKQVPHELSPNPKILELDSLLEDEIRREDKVIIYAQYQYEIRLIQNRYKKYGVVTVYGENGAAVNLENIKRFREDPSIRLIVLHPKSAAHGVTFTMAHYMIFYSINHSAEDNYQCIKRIERAGQKNPMFIFFLLARDTVDEDIYRVIQIKNSNQKNLIDQDELLMETWRKHGSKRKN